jgi:cell shape-determining protein MreC
MELYKDLIHENKILKNKNNKLETKLSKISKELEEEKNYHCAWSNVRKKDII